jgi:hypothetical protein
MLEFLFVFLPSFLVVASKYVYYRKQAVHERSSVGTIDGRELLASLGIALTVAVVSTGIFYSAVQWKAIDTQILNGVVTAKDSDHTSCTHMESCNCRYVTRKSCDSNGKNCTEYREEKCDECPIHDFDVDWNIYSSVGDYTVPRIDSQGLEEPPRWTKAVVGEPAATESWYKNPLLLDDDSLFLYSSRNVNTDKLPSYPGVYDIYRFNRVFNYTKADTSWLNDYLNSWLKYNGARHQVNMIAVLTTDTEDYFYRLMSYWKGGKKNDVILVFGIDDNGLIAWQRTNTYAMGMNNRHFIEEVQSVSREKKFDQAVIDSILTLTATKFSRIESAQFNERLREISPPTWLIVLMTVLNFISSVLVARYFTKV